MTNQTANTAPTLSPFAKIYMAVPYFITWVFYFLITQNEREEYLRGLDKGFNCIGREKETVTHVTWIYNTSEKPTRRYRTWREYWCSKGYYTNPKHTTTLTPNQ